MLTIRIHGRMIKTGNRQPPHILSLQASKDKFFCEKMKTFSKKLKNKRGYEMGPKKLKGTVGCF